MISGSMIVFLKDERFHRLALKEAAPLLMFLPIGVILEVVGVLPS